MRIDCLAKALFVFIHCKQLVDTEVLENVRNYKASNCTVTPSGGGGWSGEDVAAHQSQQKFADTVHLTPQGQAAYELLETLVVAHEAAETFFFSNCARLCNLKNLKIFFSTSILFSSSSSSFLASRDQRSRKEIVLSSWSGPLTSTGCERRHLGSHQRNHKELKHQTILSLCPGQQP